MSDANAAETFLRIADGPEATTKIKGSRFTGQALSAHSLEEAQARLAQHVVVDYLQLVRQGIDLGHADGEVGIVLVGQADAVRFYEKKEVLGIGSQRDRALLQQVDLC